MPAPASRKYLRAAREHVGSSGRTLAKQPPASTLASSGAARLAGAGPATGAASRPVLTAEWSDPALPSRSGPLAVGDGNMLLRLPDSGICETQIMSQVHSFAMVRRKNLAESRHDRLCGDGRRDPWRRSAEMVTKALPRGANR